MVDGRGWVRLPDALRADAGSRPSGWSPRRPTGTSASSDRSPFDAATGADREGAVRSVGDVAVSVSRAEIDVDSVTIGPVSMELRRGQITVITGRSGSGKTSLLSVVLGVSQATRGAVRHHVDSVGCAPQTPAFADQQSVTANVDLVRALRSKPPLDPDDGALESLGLAGLEESARRGAVRRGTPTVGRGSRALRRRCPGGARRTDVAARPGDGSAGRRVPSGASPMPVRVSCAPATTRN